MRVYTNHNYTLAKSKGSLMFFSSQSLSLMAETFNLKSFSAKVVFSLSNMAVGGAHLAPTTSEGGKERGLYEMK